MTRRRAVLATAIVLVVAAALWGWRATHKPAAITYETQSADRGPVIAKVTATGTLSALVTVQVGSQVSGRVSEIFVDYNSPVKKGQLIARIDPQLFDAAVEQARANLVAANGNLEKAKAQSVDADRQAKRQVTLAEQKLVAQADADTAAANADAARAQVAASVGAVAQAKASLNQAEVNLAYTKIVSPTDGVVISRNVDVGQTVAASLQAPTIFVIAEDLSRMQVDTSVAESDVGKLQAGMDATFTVDAYPGERFHGTVRQIRNAATTVQNVVTYDAVIDLRNPDLKLRPGMTANVSFVWAQRPDVLRVPNAALRFRPTREMLAAMGAGKRGGAGATPAQAEGAAAPAAQPASETAPATGGRDGNRASGGNGARGANGGGDPRPGREAPGSKVLYVLRGGQPVAVPVRAGVSDGTVTEILDGDLRDGDACIVDASGAARAGGGAPGGGPPGPGGPMRRVL
jgi:HlyD family secretion protein